MVTEVKEKSLFSGEFLVDFEFKWQFKPGQLVLMRVHDFFEKGKYIDTLVVVLKVIFSEEDFPEVVYGTWNRWRRGKWGGLTIGQSILGRYVSPVEVKEDHLKSIDLEDGIDSQAGKISARNLFYLHELKNEKNKVEIVYPYREE